MVGGWVFSYALKRVARSWKLFAALLLGTVLASTFFSGINIGADTAARQALDQHLSQVPVDIVVKPGYEPRKAVWSSANATEIAEAVSGSGIEGIVDVEVISRIHWVEVQLPEENKTTQFLVVGLSNRSHVYDGLTVINETRRLQANETYVWIDSPEADLELGDVLQINFSIYPRKIIEAGSPKDRGTPIIPEKPVWISLNLTVAGLVQLDDRANRIAAGYYYYYPGPYLPGPGPRPLVVAGGEYAFEGNLIIVDWGKTFTLLLDAVYALSPRYSPLTTDILVYLDRESVVNPWDISGSIDRVQVITSQIENRVWEYGAYAQNRLEYVLSSYQFMSQTMRLSFLVTAIPVFFMAWYMGTTVSDVSLNLRRREIGLLLTKGFSTGQLLRLFLSEAALIGLIGGIFGMGLGLLLTPLFAEASGGIFGEVAVIGPETVATVIAFSVIIALLSVFRPARRASRLNAVDALREYRYVEEAKPYRRKWPLIALILGTYKVITLLLGINLLAMTMEGLPTQNIIIMILLGAWIIFDTVVLGYGAPYFMPYGLGLGPILFFWGLTKVLIRGSLKFQELTTRTAGFLGDLGPLATRNVQRNPARAASVAFLIALILGYSVQIVGVYASERDYTIRQIRFGVGADIGIPLTTLENASLTMSQIENLTGVSSAVLEYTFYGQSAAGGATLKAVDPGKWLEIAHYEEELFGGSDVATAFQQMRTDNHTIILERGVASRLDLSVGHNITLSFGEGREITGSETYTLRIVGFFGSEPLQGPIYYGYGGMSLWSYVPEGLYHMVEDTVYAAGRILVRLEVGADGGAVADQVRELELDNVATVYSVAEQLEEWQSDVMISGPMNVQRLGVAFAVLAASLGTALVVLVSLRERSKEVSIMSARGLSFGQLTVMLLTENLAVVVFAALLGAFGGLVIVQGNVAAANAMPFSYSVLTRHVVFPMDTVLTLLACFALVFASTIIPVIVMAKRYISRLERMVREA